MKFLHKLFSSQLGNPQGIFGRWVGSLLLAYGNRSVSRWLLGRTKDIPASRILEIGYGPGETMVGYGSQHPGVVVLGVEVSEAMQKLAQEKVDRRDLGNRVFPNLYDGTTLPFSDHSFDIVYAIFVLYFIPDLDAFAREVFRVTQPGGQIFMIFSDKSALQRRGFDPEVFHMRTLDEVVESFQRAGFTTTLEQVKGAYWCLVGESD